jgi:hypothetical protein
MRTGLGGPLVRSLAINPLAPATMYAAGTVCRGLQDDERAPRTGPR